MSKADDELTHFLHRAERAVAIEGLFEALEEREVRFAEKCRTEERSYPRTGSPSRRAWELLLTILRSAKR